MSNFTNLFKTGLVGTYSDTDTTFTVDDASDLTVPCTILVYDEDFNNPLNAYNNSAAEICTVSSKSTNDLTVSRGQEGTTALTIGSGNWKVIQTVTAGALDARFYTETETDNLLAGKSDTGHTHTEADITDLGNYAVVGHSHSASDITSGTFADARIAQSNVIQHQAALSITESQISDLQSYLLATDIDTLAELNSILTDATLVDSGHTHTESDITDLGNYSVVGHTHDGRYYTETEVDNLLSGKSDTGHTHDGRYYTESEIDSQMSGKADLSGDTFTGTIKANGAVANPFRRGITGGYNDTSSGSSNFGSNIWSIGDGWAGSGHGSGFTLDSSQYGLVWLRTSHPSAVSGIGEGLYLYRSGTRIASFGNSGSNINNDLDVGGSVTSTQFNGSGAGLTGSSGFRATGTTKGDVGLSNVPNTDATNASNISSGTLASARLPTINLSDLGDWNSGDYQTSISASSSGSITLSKDTLHWRKHGETYFVWGRLEVSSVSSPSGSMTVDLPAALKSGDKYRATVSLFFNNISGTSVNRFVGVAYPGLSEFKIFKGDAGTVQQDSADHMQSGTTIDIFVSFIAQ